MGHVTCGVCYEKTLFPASLKDLLGVHHACMGPMLLCLNEQNLLKWHSCRIASLSVSEVASMHFGGAVHVAVARLSQLLSSPSFFLPLCWPDNVFRFIIE
jgi:hypothetical protein